MPDVMLFFRSKRRAALLPVCMALGALLLVAVTASRPADPFAGVAGVIQADANTAHWGVAVMDLTSGQMLFEYNGGKAFLPASTQKILTTAAALEALGPDYRYKTVLYFDGRLERGVLRGDLILKGSGDPTFGSIEIGGADPLRRWAAELKAMGITGFEGRIIGDDDAFDNVRFAEGWDIDYLSNQASRLLGVAAGGLAYRDNVVELRVTSGAPGAPPTLSTVPEGFAEIRNGAMTAARTRGSAVEVQRDMVNEKIVVRGTVPRSYNASLAIPVVNPTAFALESFASSLRQAGLAVKATLHDVDLLDQKPVYDRLEPLFVEVSPPLQQIIAITNKESNNFYAEQLFRTIAYGGSAAGGEARLKQLLGKAGANVGAVSIRDGSGLSRKNYVTPETMVRLLTYMHQGPHRAAFLTSIARAGEYHTTMGGRLSGLPIYAKTGSLDFVRSLAGYARLADGRPVAFAVMANNYTASSHAITYKIDAIVNTFTAPPAAP